jgi:hypothetical protein
MMNYLPSFIKYFGTVVGLFKVGEKRPRDETPTNDVRPLLTAKLARESSTEGSGESPHRSTKRRKVETMGLESREQQEEAEEEAEEEGNEDGHEEQPEGTLAQSAAEKAQAQRPNAPAVTWTQRSFLGRSHKSRCMFSWSLNFL